MQASMRAQSSRPLAKRRGGGAVQLAVAARVRSGVGRSALACRASAGHHNGNGTGHSSSSGPVSVRVRFHMPYRVELGDHLAVVGAGDHLGNWQVAQRLALQWNEGDVWAGDVEVPAGSVLEYKYLVVRGGGGVEWSPGNNFMLEVAHSRRPGCIMEVHEGWVNDGPRNVSISEPEPERSATSAGPPTGTTSVAAPLSPADVVSSANHKLQSATQRLARSEWEASVVGLLSQYPLMPPDRIHKAMQALKPKKPDLSLFQLEELLEQMVREEKLVELGGRYRLHASHRFAGGRATPAQQGGSQQQSQEPTAAQLVPAVMRLLEAYASMSLDRMLRALSSAGPAEVRGVTEAQLRDVLAQLASERRVLESGDGQYRKGLATPSASRRAGTPSASRKGPSGSPSPGPSAAARLGHNRAHPSTAASSSSASASAPLPASRPPMTADQLSAYEQRALSLLSNYSGCTAERIHTQLKATSDFPGTPQDTLRMLRALAGEGRVKETAGGIFTYQSTRQATPAGARGPSPPRASSPAPRRAAASSPALATASGIGALRGPTSSSSAASSSGASRFSPGGSRSPSPTATRHSVAVASSASHISASTSNAGTKNRKVAARGMSAGMSPSPRPASASSPRPSSSTSPSPGSGPVRRNLSAYSIFCAERREVMRSALPRGTSFSEITRALIEEWEAAPEALRRRYEAAAERDRKRYEEEMRQHEERERGGQEARVQA